MSAEDVVGEKSAALGRRTLGEARTCSPKGKRGACSPVHAGTLPPSSVQSMHPAHGASTLPRSPRNAKSHGSPVLWEQNPGCLGTVGEQRTGTEPRFGGWCRPGVVTQRPGKAGAGVWRSPGGTGAGTSTPDPAACSTGVKGAPGKLGAGDRGGSQRPSVLSQGCELPPEGQEEPPKNVKQGSKVI